MKMVVSIPHQRTSFMFSRCFLLQKSFKLVNARLQNQVKAGSFGAGGLVPGLVHDAEKQLSRWKVRRFEHGYDRSAVGSRVLVTAVLDVYLYVRDCNTPGLGA